MSMWTDLLGTTKSILGIGKTGVKLKDSSGNLIVRNNADSADSEITASKVNVSGNAVDINSDAAGAGADWKYTLQRPASGMTADVTLTLPVDDGSPGQVLSTDGSGVLSFVSAGSTDALTHVDTTTVAFGSSATVSMFTLPANAVIEKVQVVIDTAFDSTPSMSVGVNGGSASKYMGTGDVGLTATAKTVWENHPGEVANGSTEALEIAYTAASASVGSARVLVHYSVPA